MDDRTCHVSSWGAAGRPGTLAPGGGGKARKAPAQRKEGDVEGWDFVSAHAITQEYTDNLASIVSLL